MHHKLTVWSREIIIDREARDVSWHRRPHDEEYFVPVKRGAGA